MKLKYNPKSIIIDQTKLCNQNCYFCYRSSNEFNPALYKDSEPHLDRSLYNRIIDEASKITSLKWLSLCGPLGDPLMVPDLVGRLRYAKEKNHFSTILINTNGQALNRHNMEEMLNVCTDIQFSVDSIDKETYGKIHTLGKFEKVISNIKELYSIKKKKKSKAHINIRFTEGEYNIGQWDEFHQYFKQFSDSVFRVKEHSFLNVRSMQNSQLGALLCNQPYQVVNFTFKGDLTTCCINWQLSPTFGNILNASLKELWEGNDITEWRRTRMKSICSECSGLGGFSQRVISIPNFFELKKAEIINEKGEEHYYKKIAVPYIIKKFQSLLSRLKGIGCLRR